MLLQELVEQDFGIEGRGKWYHSSDHDSLVVNAEEQTWFWNSKGIRGNIFDYLVQVRGMTKEQAKDFLKNSFGDLSNSTENKPYQPPYEKLIELMWSNGIKNRNYWYKRCLNDSTIDRYKLGYYDGWSLIPLYEDGEFVNFQCRREEPEKRIVQWYRHGKTILFNDAILPFTKTIFITEGTVDAILLNQEGFPAVSPNGTNTWQQLWANKFMHIDKIYYVEDNDSAGRIGARLVANSLGLYRVKIISYLEKREKYDTVNLYQDIRDGITNETFRDYIQSSKYLFELE